MEDPSLAGVNKTAARDAARHIETRSPSCWNEERCGGQPDVFVSKESSCDSPPVPQILSQLRVEVEMMPVPEDAMEAQPDVEMGTESVRSGTRRASSTWEGEYCW